MEKIQINPWEWQDRLGFSQAWQIDGARSVVFLSGQIPVSAGGTVVAGDFDAQARQVFANIRAVLDRAGADFGSVVKLTVFVTDISKLADYRRIKAEFISGPQPASTAVEVRSLALPEILIEVEAIAVL
jgi:2-iminobutanoate/2-iminopropanoate deaminase